MSRQNKRKIIRAKRSGRTKIVMRKQKTDGNLMMKLKPRLERSSKLKNKSRNQR
jgi:hypothetical protein